MGRHNYQPFADGYGIKCSRCRSIVMAEQGFICASELPARAARLNVEYDCPPRRGIGQAFGYDHVPVAWIDLGDVARNDDQSVRDALAEAAKVLRLVADRMLDDMTEAEARELEAKVAAAAAPFTSEGGIR